MDRKAEPRCRRCSYALRRMSLDAMCPECGLPIAASFGHQRPSRRASIILVASGVSYGALVLASFFIAFHFDAFLILDDSFVIVMYFSPLVALGIALVAAARGVRLHWVAVVIFWLFVTASTTAVFWMVAQASAAV